MGKSGISTDSARAQIDVMLDYYDIDYDDIVIEQGKEAAETITNYLVRAIQKGRLQIENTADGLVIVQKLQFPMGDVNEIKYKEVNEQANIEASKAGNNGELAKLAFMGSLAGIESTGFGKLKGVDYGTFQRLSTLFSMV